MRNHSSYGTNSLTKDRVTEKPLVGNDLEAPSGEETPHEYVDRIINKLTTGDQYSNDLPTPVVSQPHQRGELIPKRFEFAWTGTMKDFATNPMTTKFVAKPEVPIPEGNQLILVSSEITQIQNTSPVPVGIKFDGMPVNHTVVTGSGKDFHLVIPPETRQPKAENIMIYRTQDIPGGFTEQDLKGWDAHNSESIAASVVKKDKAAGIWTIAASSPIIAAAIADGISENSMAIMQSVYDPEVKYVCVKASLGEKYLKLATDYRNSMPFEDISKISATIYREDGQQWRDALQNDWSSIGSDGSLASRVALDYANSPHHIRVSINNNYICWKVGA